MGLNSTCSSYPPAGFTPNEPVRGLKAAASVPTASTFVTVNVAVPLFVTVMLFLTESCTLTRPKSSEPAVAISGAAGEVVPGGIFRPRSGREKLWHQEQSYFLSFTCLSCSLV